MIRAMSVNVERTSQPRCSPPHDVSNYDAMDQLTFIALEIGQIIRAPEFSFLDALGALEIMDPKTDSGMIVEDEEADDPPEIQILLPEEVVWIIDQLLAREV